MPQGVIGLLKKREKLDRPEARSAETSTLVPRKPKLAQETTA
jgi:hypothetical protein